MRTCNGKRRDGAECRSTAVMADGFCRLHSPVLAVDPVENGRRAGIASGAARREQGKSVRKRLADRLEENVELIWQAFEDGLHSEDERVRIVAATSVLAEAFGKPAVTLVGEEERPVSFQIVSAFAADAEIDAGDA